MKKTFKKILIAFVAVLGLASLTGCNHANTYNKFHNNNSLLSKSHVLKEIDSSDLEDLISKLKKDKKIDGAKTVKESEDENAKSYTYIYVFLGTPTDSTATSNAAIFDEQAKQNEISCLYWIDTELSDSKVEKLNKVLFNSAAKVESRTCALMSIRTTVGKQDALLSFDSTSVVCNKKDGVASGRDLTAQQIAQNCFKNLTTIIS